MESVNRWVGLSVIDSNLLSIKKQGLSDWEHYYEILFKNEIHWLFYRFRNKVHFQ